MFLFRPFLLLLSMLLLPHKNLYAKSEAVDVLEQEIALLEAELLQLETSINVFQLQIRAALATQIQRIHELTSLYKNQKQAKKLKRLEQKKRGKNYQGPVGLKTIHASSNNTNPVATEDQQELKRLFKEAIVKIHPDKFVNADEGLNRRATTVTAQLNEVYKSGDLEELNRLHEHILSGNALTYVPDQPKTINDLPAMTRFLRQKKLKLLQLMEEIKTSGIYGLFTGGKDIQILISELKTQFEQRIVLMEKRTK